MIGSRSRNVKVVSALLFGSLVAVAAGWASAVAVASSRVSSRRPPVTTSGTVTQTASGTMTAGTTAPGTTAPATTAPATTTTSTSTAVTTAPVTTAPVTTTTTTTTTATTAPVTTTPKRPTGGAGIGGTGVDRGGTTGATKVQSANAIVSASGSGLTVQTFASAALDRALAFTGSAPAGTAGQTLEIEIAGQRTAWEWQPAASVTIAPGGSFAAEWQTDLAGRLAVRAVIPLAAASALSQPVTATSSLTVTVYRVSLATQYGPGFYGRHTACGQKLTVTTVGVANRTLRCGTPIAIYYRSRTLVAPVIDRGPYANGADWDLTAATARELRIPGTAMIGAVALPRKFAQPRS